MKTLIIDNYDSFTYNLCQHIQYIGELGGKPAAFRDDEIGVRGEIIKARVKLPDIKSPSVGTQRRRGGYWGIF